MASDATDLAGVYASALGAPVVVNDELGQTLAQKLSEAQAAHPTIRLDASKFVRHLAQKTSSDSPLPTLLAADLYLARACGEGLTPALAAFRDLHGMDIRDVHARSSGSRPPLDELTQAVHEKLFVGSHPKILDYSGTGKLKNWVRVVTSRTLVDLIRERDPAAEPHDSEAPLGIPAPDDDPELQYLKLKYRSEIKEAFEHAVTLLSAEERNALREYYVHGLGIDQIAELRGIHRSTAARRVSSAREAVLKATRRVLMERTGLGHSELESLVRMVESQMHVTVERVLGTA